MYTSNGTVAGILSISSLSLLLSLLIKLLFNSVVLLNIHCDRASSIIEYQKLYTSERWSALRLTKSSITNRSESYHVIVWKVIKQIWMSDRQFSTLLSKFCIGSEISSITTKAKRSIQSTLGSLVPFFTLTVDTLLCQNNVYQPIYLKYSSWIYFWYNARHEVCNLHRAAKWGIAESLKDYLHHPPEDETYHS